MNQRNSLVSVVAELREEVAQQAYLFDDPDGYRSGVRDACSALKAALDSQVREEVDRRLQAVHHELVNPMHVIHSAAATLHDRGDELDRARERELLAAIQRKAELLARLLDTLRDSVDEHLGDRVNPRVLDVGDLVRRVSAEMEWLVRAHELTLKVRSPLIGSADPDAIERILVALLTNAVKFSPVGTGIEVTARRASGCVQVQVVDSGPGVPPADREAIFGKYVRLETGVPGSGLGLYLARQLARAQGGNLTMGASNGGGATFLLDVPTAPPAATGARRIEEGADAVYDLDDRTVAEA